MLGAILFDFNGVLLDDEPVHLELLQALAAEHGLALAAEDYYARYVGFDDRGALAAIWRDRGRELAADELRRLLAEKSRRYDGVMRERDLFFPGAAELVRDAARRAPIAVVSGALRGEIVAALKGAGIFDRFTALVSAEDVTRGKPDPEGYVRGLDAVNRDRARHRKEPVSPRNVLVIEDTDAGVQAAKSAGMKVVAVGHTMAPHRLQEADAFVHRVVDLSLEALEKELF